MKTKQDFMEIKELVGKDIGDIRFHHLNIMLMLINFQAIYPKVNENFPSHVHTSFELIIPIKKCYQCTLCNRNISIKNGEFILIQPGQSHSDCLSKDEPFLCMHFTLLQPNSKERIQSLFIPGLLPDKQIAQIPEYDFINDIFKLAENYKSQSLPLHVFDHIFTGIFQLLLKAYPPKYLKLNSNSENIQSYTYQRIFNYFNDCLEKNNFSTADFCKILNCSSRSLTRICHEYFFQPPYQAFQSYRLNATLRFLQENPNVTVKETAQIFGYPDAFHFSKAFKKTFGISPSKVKIDLEYKQ